MNMRLIKLLVLVFSASVMMLACNIGEVLEEADPGGKQEETEQGAMKLPEIIDYKAPHFPPLLEMPNTGCSDTGYGWITCAEGSPLFDLGCMTISPLDDSLGGLEPALPVMSCRMERLIEDLPPEEYLYNIGCMDNLYVRMITWHDGEFDLIKGIPDLKRLFAPVESEAEAVSYAVAATGYRAEFGFEVVEGYRYLTNTIEETHAVATEDGYVVNLFGYVICGCGPHTNYRVDVTVSREGAVSIGEPIPLYEDPEQDGLCVD